MFRSKLLSSALLLFSIGIFLFPLLPANTIAEELLEEGTEQSKGVNELPKFDPATHHVREHVAMAANIAKGVSWKAHDALPAQEHVDEVPVPPPEA